MADPFHSWHVAINGYHYPKDGGPPAAEHSRWMYQAKDAAQEVKRLPLLFQRERDGTLPKIHRQCSHSESVPVVKNELTWLPWREMRNVPSVAGAECDGRDSRGNRSGEGVDVRGAHH